MADSVIHFEIPLDDADRGHGFYRDVFGWDIQPMPEFEYAFAMTSPVDEQGAPSKPGAINGGMMKREEPLSKPVITIGVENIDATLAKVESAGGSTVMAKQAVADMGFTAYFHDSEGNVMGLWQNAG
ncbi:MAG: VOC family protein [Propionibacteriales bacterium]|nr:VOC family protein [Propionibacteriales bacterium]